MTIDMACGCKAARFGRLRSAHPSLSLSTHCPATMTDMQVDEPKLDEGLYSRQL